VDALEALADAAVVLEPDEAMEDVVRSVLAHEIAFWDMAEPSDG
jgi:hypothetical protein